MKRGLVLLLACLAALMLSGCAEDRSAIYDDDARIARQADSHASNMSAYSQNGGELSMTARAFIGAKTLWRYTAPEDGEVAVDYVFEAREGGRAKLVLIGPDGAVSVLAESTGEAEVEEIRTVSVPVQKGSNRIKLVGDDAKGITMTLGIDVGDLVGK